MFFFDPMYLLFVLPAIILTMYAQAKVHGTYRKFSQVRNAQNLTGAQVARYLLRAKGLGDVPVEMTPGELTDHYDPGKRVLRLSDGVYNAPSVAAMGIAAHEVGHVYQHNDNGYVFMRLRAPLVPVANIGSNAGVWLAMLGVFMQSAQLLLLGVILFGAAVVFTLVTLPIELNASNRAMQALRSCSLVSASEYRGARSVLSAAALTYVAAALQSVMILLYFVLRFVGMDRRSD